MKKLAPLVAVVIGLPVVFASSTPPPEAQSPLLLDAKARLCALQAGPPPQVPPPVTPRQLAMTVDDFPHNGESRPAVVRDAAVQVKELTARTQSWDAPVTAFVNEATLYRFIDEERSEVLAEPLVEGLKNWVAAGNKLGNHGYSHKGADGLSVEEFRDELLRGEVVTRSVLQAHGQELRLFRYPYLQDGSTPQHRASLNGVLAEKGYVAAPVTSGFETWRFEHAYKQTSDSAERAALREEYVRHLRRILLANEELSIALTGDRTPEILLTHSTEFTADVWPDLMSLLREMEFEAISLETALAHPTLAWTTSGSATTGGHGENYKLAVETGASEDCIWYKFIPPRTDIWSLQD